MYNRKKDKNGLAASTVRHIHLVIHQAMQTALRRGMILFDPTAAAVLPKKDVTEKTVLQKHQVDKLLDNLKNDPIWYEFFFTELMTGMRRGEICALKWCDFDSESGTLHIRRSVRYEKGEPVVGETKTSEGSRNIILPESVKNMLAERRKTVQGEWIFPNPFR